MVGSNTERRRARRFNGRVAIVSTDSEGLNFNFITDISRDGAYIETEKLLPLGTEFQFQLANRVTRAPIIARVIRVHDAFFEGGKSGIGVRFERLDHMAKVLRDDLLLYLMSLDYQAMWQAA